MVSTGTASGAATSGATARLRSRSSRIACSRSTTSGSAPSSAGAAARALRRVGGQIDLDLGAGRDDRGDVAALGDPVAVGEDALLLLHERLADRGVGGDARGGLGHPRLADALRHVLAVEQHAVAELEPRAAGERCRGRRRRRSRPRRRGTSHPCRGR